MILSEDCIHEYKTRANSSFTVASVQKALTLDWGCRQVMEVIELTFNRKGVLDVPGLDVNLFSIENVVVQHGLPDS